MYTERRRPSYRRVMSYHSPAGKEPQRLATVYNDRHNKTYVVFFYEDQTVGKVQDYSTDSLEDAVTTASLWVNWSSRPGQEETVTKK